MRPFNLLIPCLTVLIYPSPRSLLKHLVKTVPCVLISNCSLVWFLMLNRISSLISTALNLPSLFPLNDNHMEGVITDTFIFVLVKLRCYPSKDKTFISG